MKNSYPIVLTPGVDGYSVYIPDFDTGTQGEDLTEAIEMARDAIGLMGIDMEDDRKALPVPSDISEVRKSDAGLVEPRAGQIVNVEVEMCPTHDPIVKYFRCENVIFVQCVHAFEVSRLAHAHQ